MFRRFYKSKSVLLNCPYCGNTQQEPALVISSFCQECGEHFRVQKGKALPSPGHRVTGLAEIRQPRDKSVVSKETEAPEKDAPKTDNTPDKDETSKPEEITAGEFFGLIEDEKSNEPGGKKKKKPLGKEAQSREILSEGNMGTLLQSQDAPAIVMPEKEKMPANYVEPDARKKRTDPASDLPVRCFRCYHIQNVSRFAKSTQCERCSVYISLANYEISALKSHTLRTRGNIQIAKKGGLIKDSEIACHNLTVNGAIDARVDCSGSAVFRSSGTVKGQLYCEKLTVEKNCEMKFPDGVKTKEANIRGHLIGNVTCSGSLRVGKTAVLEGNATAVSFDIKEGGKIDGKKEVDPKTSTELPLKMGFNPTIIG